MTTFKVSCDPWGVTVERVEVKSLVVAREMVVPMAREAKAAREANGLVILQRGEKQCLQQIRGAADCMQETPAAVSLKYLQVVQCIHATTTSCLVQVLNNISTKNNRSVVLPLPKSMIKKSLAPVHQAALPLY